MKTAQRKVDSLTTVGGTHEPPQSVSSGLYPRRLELLQLQKQRNELNGLILLSLWIESERGHSSANKQKPWRETQGDTCKKHRGNLGSRVRSTFVENNTHFGSVRELSHTLFFQIIWITVLLFFFINWNIYFYDALLKYSWFTIVY